MDNTVSQSLVRRGTNLVRFVASFETTEGWLRHSGFSFWSISGTPHLKTVHRREVGNVDLIWDRSVHYCVYVK